MNYPYAIGSCFLWSSLKTFSPYYLLPITYYLLPITYYLLPPVLIAVLPPRCYKFPQSQILNRPNFFNRAYLGHIQSNS